ncbi:MAG: Rne/Rng family ribonuclease [Pseudorhodoplanes sp.]|nr:Rne/Rng family ribonuclease [Pseudorhodoplanes sp.]
MPNKMLIDATHPEETRVVVLRGNRVEEFDFESASRKQLRGNIYLAKVTRVEPSLQAAFVDYGGNRHGFLAFSEIHPDYYQIPVADRQALLEEERLSREDDENGNGESRGGRRRGRHRHRRRGADRNRHRDVMRSAPLTDETTTAIEPAGEDQPHETIPNPFADPQQDNSDAVVVSEDTAPLSQETAGEASPEQPLADETTSVIEELAQSAAAQDVVVPLPTSEEVPLPVEEASQDTSAQPDVTVEASADAADVEADVDAKAEENGNGSGENGDDDDDDDDEDEDEDEDDDEEEENGDEEEEEVVESVGGDALEEVQERAPRYRRHYKIQEVIKRRQVMLVQVVKEERGTKGAALTTYLSLAGRYSVLMPNTARGGGISRKVTSAEDRKKMKEVAEGLDVPEGMGVILRTAGASRTKTEIKRDFEYLLRLWENVRDLTLKSTAPTLVYEEGSLVKRSIRDLYHSDIDDIIVEGENAYREAKDFMRMLMPSHAKNVHLYHDAQPIFTRYGIEPQLDAMFSSTVQLKSGGYIVINQAEALVAIDVNSGRATREHSIEETALKTNSEAAAEIARQLRLRDLAGLIVIDFIDMDENRNNRAVERKLKEALKSDRARIQVGRISHFGLLEMSRQRIRSSMLESSTDICPHCGGTGHVRSVSSVALQLVRSLEETLLKGATHNLIARTRSDVAIYVLNHKRAHLRTLEERFRVAITVTTDPTLTGHPPFAIDRGEQVMTLEQAKALITVKPDSVMPYAEEEEEDEILEEEMEEAVEAEGEAEAADAEQPGGERKGRRRRRGRRGRGGRDSEPRETVAEHSVEHGEDAVEDDGREIEAPGLDEDGRELRGDGEGRRRRRGRRGGRRNRRGRDENGNGHPQPVEREGQAESPAYQADAQPREIRPYEEAVNDEQPPYEAPPAEPVTSAPPAAETEEKPRRRSTVREPAPIFSSGSDDTPSALPPAPAPAETPAATDEAGQAEKPRRFGWWSRRG